MILSEVSGRILKRERERDASISREDFLGRKPFVEFGWPPGVVEEDERAEKRRRTKNKKR